LSCYTVTPFLRTVAPPPCLPLYIKDLLKEDAVYWLDLVEDWLIGWLLARGGSYCRVACKNDAAAAAASCCVSASLRTETLRENMGQCKSEGKTLRD
jgi:hypothetical protein